MKKIGIFFLLMLLLLFITSCEDDDSTSPDVDDDNPPSIFIQVPTPENAHVTTQNKITLGGIASDAEALDKITWSTNTKDSGTASGLENWTASDIPLQAGANTIVVTAHDKGGNTSSDEIIVTRNNFVGFYSTPVLNPTGIIVSTPTSVTITASLDPGPEMQEDSVTLEINNSGTWAPVTQLYDDGNLSHGDEILGDNVYSAIHSFNLPGTGDWELRVSATSISNEEEFTEYSSTFTIGVYEQLTDDDFNEINTMQDEVGDVFETNLAGGDIPTAINETYNWVSQQPGVVNSQIVENGIEIMYDSGIVGGIRIYQQGADGSITTKGWMKDQVRSAPKPPKFPTYGYNSGLGMRTEDSEDLIGNKNILIWAPFENAFGIDMRPSLETIIGNSDLEFNVVTMTNTQCTVSSLNNLTEYGIVIFDTHGSEGMEIGTGEEVTAYSYLANAINLLTNRVAIWQNVTVGYTGGVANKEDVFAVRAPFISALSGTFPNSLIFNGSCESTKALDLKNAFMNKGAQAYFGFDKVVNTQFCKDVCDDLIEEIVVNLETTGDAFTSGQTDPVSPNATYEMYGNTDLHFTLELINGDFEMGDLTGWTRSGDGRVISMLGSASPYEGSFMGIISTGLGFTESSGSIYQTFKVMENKTDLSLYWNFMSEEFMEYVGSQYQDYFRITIVDETGTETVLFEKTIDQIAAEYSPYLVSPEIAFDIGDVYATGWNQFEFDLSAFEGQIVTIRFSAGDVGDSIYDTAILLDDIEVY